MSDVWNSGTPLSNQDFRKLLQTPRPHDTPLRSSLAPGYQPRPKPVKVSYGDDDKPRKFKQPPPKFTKPKQGGEEGDDAKYR